MADEEVKDARQRVTDAEKALATALEQGGGARERDVLAQAKADLGTRFEARAARALKRVTATQAYVSALQAVQPAVMAKSRAAKDDAQARAVTTKETHANAMKQNENSTHAVQKALLKGEDMTVEKIQRLLSGLPDPTQPTAAELRSKSPLQAAAEEIVSDDRMSSEQKQVVLDALNHTMMQDGAKYRKEQAVAAARAAAAALDGDTDISPARRAAVRAAIAEALNPSSVKKAPSLPAQKARVDDPAKMREDLMKSLEDNAANNAEGASAAAAAPLASEATEMSTEDLHKAAARTGRARAEVMRIEAQLRELRASLEASVNDTATEKASTESDIVKAEAALAKATQASARAAAAGRGALNRTQTDLSSEDTAMEALSGPVAASGSPGNFNHGKSGPSALALKLQMAMISSKMAARREVEAMAAADEVNHLAKLALKSGSAKAWELAQKSREATQHAAELSDATFQAEQLVTKLRFKRTAEMAAMAARIEAEEVRRAMYGAGSTGMTGIAGYGAEYAGDNEGQKTLSALDDDMTLPPSLRALIKGKLAAEVAKTKAKKRMAEISKTVDAMPGMDKDDKTALKKTLQGLAKASAIRDKQKATCEAAKGDKVVCKKAAVEAAEELAKLKLEGTMSSLGSAVSPQQRALIKQSVAAAEAEINSKRKAKDALEALENNPDLSPEKRAALKAMLMASMADSKKKHGEDAARAAMAQSGVQWPADASSAQVASLQAQIQKANAAAQKAAGNLSDEDRVKSAEASVRASLNRAGLPADIKLAMERSLADAERKAARAAKLKAAEKAIDAMDTSAANKKMMKQKAKSAIGEEAQREATKHSVAALRDLPNLSETDRAKMAADIMTAAKAAHDRVKLGEAEEAVMGLGLPAQVREALLATMHAKAMGGNNTNGTNATRTTLTDPFSLEVVAAKAKAKAAFDVCTERARVVAEAAGGDANTTEKMLAPCQEQLETAQDSIATKLAEKMQKDLVSVRNEAKEAKMQAISDALDTNPDLSEKQRDTYKKNIKAVMNKERAAEEMNMAKKVVDGVGKGGAGAQSDAVRQELERWVPKDGGPESGKETDSMFASALKALEAKPDLTPAQKEEGRTKLLKAREQWEADKESADALQRVESDPNSSPDAKNKTKALIQMGMSAAAASKPVQNKGGKVEKKPMVGGGGVDAPTATAPAPVQKSQLDLPKYVRDLNQMAPAHMPPAAQQIVEKTGDNLDDAKADAENRRRAIDTPAAASSPTVMASAVQQNTLAQSELESRKKEFEQSQRLKTDAEAWHQQNAEATKERKNAVKA